MLAKTSIRTVFVFLCTILISQQFQNNAIAAHPDDCVLYLGSGFTAAPNNYFLPYESSLGIISGKVVKTEMMPPSQRTGFTLLGFNAKEAKQGYKFKIKEGRGSTKTVVMDAFSQKEDGSFIGRIYGSSPNNPYFIEWTIDNGQLASLGVTQSMRRGNNKWMLPTEEEQELIVKAALLRSFETKEISSGGFALPIAKVVSRRGTENRFLNSDMTFTFQNFDISTRDVGKKFNIGKANREFGGIREFTVADFVKNTDGSFELRALSPTSRSSYALFIKGVVGKNGAINKLEVIKGHRWGSEIYRLPTELEINMALKNLTKQWKQLKKE